jgi:hypothetical protein
MAASKPVRLCQYDLPSGKRCGQIALQGEPLCRHHRRLLYHDHEAASRREERLADLATHLESETLIGMLNILRKNLSGIHRVVRYYPEANTALQAVIERIRQINSSHAHIQTLTSPDQVEELADSVQRMTQLLS